MEINEQKVGLQQVTQNLPASLPNISPQITREDSISVYRDSFSVSNAIDQFKKLKQAFPQLPAGFYELLIERIKENGFTDQRLKDAINYLVDNFNYPVPTIANVVGFDKRVKLLTYGQLIEVHDRTGRAFEDYCSIKKNGKYFWISKSEKEMFNIKDEL